MKITSTTYPHWPIQEGAERLQLCITCLHLAGVMTDAEASKIKGRLIKKVRVEIERKNRA